LKDFNFQNYRCNKNAFIVVLITRT